MSKSAAANRKAAIIKKVQGFYAGIDGHGWDHVKRVYRTALWLTHQVGGSEEIVEAASLLHDIARSKEEKGQCSCHAQEGASMAKPILISLGYSHQEVKKIAYAIASHRFSKGIVPTTLEAQVLQDADRLDALGAIAIARVLHYNGYHGLPIYDETVPPEASYHGQKTTAINHFYEKILKITPESFHTPPARKAARKRYRFIIVFLERFSREWAGLDLN